MGIFCKSVWGGRDVASVTHQEPFCKKVLGTPKTFEKGAWGLPHRLGSHALQKKAQPWPLSCKHGSVMAVFFLLDLRSGAVGWKFLLTNCRGRLLEDQKTNGHRKRYDVSCSKTEKFWSNFSKSLRDQRAEPLSPSANSEILLPPKRLSQTAFDT